MGIMLVGVDTDPEVKLHRRCYAKFTCDHDGCSGMVCSFTDEALSDFFTRAKSLGWLERFDFRDREFLCPQHSGKRPR